MYNELEATIREAAQEFIESGSQQKKIFLYPDDVNGLKPGKIVQVIITYGSLAKLENRPE